MNKIIFFLLAVIFITACKNRKDKVEQNSFNKNIKEEYYSDGKIKVRAKLKGSLEHGGYFRFYKNKNVKESGVKIKGKKNGLWKHYDSIGSLTLVSHYYNDSLICNLDVNDFEYCSRKIAHNLQLEIPNKWELINNIDNNSILLALRKRCDESYSFCPSLTITRDSIVKRSEIEGYLKKGNDFLSSSLEAYKVVKERKYSYSGRDYYEKIYIGNSQNLSLGGITTWIFDNRNTYIVTGFSLNEKENSFLKYQGLFKDIIDRIEFK